MMMWFANKGGCSINESKLKCVQGDHLQLLLQGLLGSSRLPSHETLMGISAGLFLPTTWLPDLGALSYVGALGVISALGLTGRGCQLASVLLFWWLCFCSDLFVNRHGCSQACVA